MENPKIEQARHLYFAQAKTQKEIAHILDVSEKTIYNWIKRHSWDQLRQAARQAPALITENLCSQIVELQNSISRREPGERYPTSEESLVMQRLINMLEKMKKFPGLAMNTQVLETFRNWMRPRDKSFTRDLSLYAGLFLQGYAQNGYRPYELEFGIDKVSPVDSFYEEEPLEDSISVEPKHDSIVDLRSSEHTEEALRSEPENQPSESTQIIEDQASCNTETTLPPPVKTGNSPAFLPLESCGNTCSGNEPIEPRKIEGQIDDSPLGGGGKS